MSENEAAVAEATGAQKMLDSITGWFVRARDEIAHDARPDTPIERTSVDLLEATRGTRGDSKKVLEACSTRNLLTPEYKEAACGACGDALEELKQGTVALQAQLGEARFVGAKIGDPTTSGDLQEDLSRRIGNAEGLLTTEIPGTETFANRNMKMYCTTVKPPGM